jgi:non-specific serine/threonine protein kinase
LHNQGYVALGQEDVAGARELFRESLRRHQERANISGIAEGLAGLAAVSAAQGGLAQAVRLFGAAEGVRAEHRGPVWPAERFEVERQIEAVRARLPEPHFAEHRRAGTLLSLEHAIAEALAPALGQPPAASRGTDGLTPREHEVARLIAQGHSNRAIAAALVISERTTEHHVANILAKLDFSSRAQVAAWVVATKQTPSSG